MPRQARLDAPGTLHHVILRGIARGTIVADAEDRAAFLGRLGDVATATGTTLYAWALLPNHAHLLLRSGPAGLPPGHAPAPDGVRPGVQPPPPAGGPPLPTPLQIHRRG